MGKTARVHATQQGGLHDYGSEVVVGAAFAFFRPGALRKPGLSWAARLFGQAADAPRIVPLLGRDALELPGARIVAARLPPLSLAVVTSDKALYREARDEVHLLALDPLSPNEEAVLEIRQSGAPFGSQPVRLDDSGAAAVTLRDLPAGEYEVRMRSAAADLPPCSFTVAAYRLAPLVASLAERRFDAGKLSAVLRVESFGKPVDGRLEVELHDRGRRVARTHAEARDGLAEVTFALSGEGPHAINVQLAADPSRTATVPIVGSRASERSRTVLSTLGAEVTASLLPGPASQEVRGLFLDEGAVRTSPLRLDRVDTRRARLSAASAVGPAVVVVLDPTYPTAGEGAVDPDAAPHPATYDVRYRRGEALFHDKRFAEAAESFEEGRAAQSPPHPNYAYYVACCHARDGRTEQALRALRAALCDGFRDMDLLARDDDLASLHGDPRFEVLRAGPRREIAVGALAEGESIEIDVPGPMALLVVGAFVGGEPWEGWAATIAPVAARPRVVVPERCVPGEDLRIEVSVGDGAALHGSSVYVVVKDARLLSPDTPTSRLAGGLKALAEAASRELEVGRPASTLDQIAPPPVPVKYRRPPPPPMAMPAAFGGPPPMPVAPSPMGAPLPPPPPSPGFRPAPAAAPAAPAAFGPSGAPSPEDLALAVGAQGAYEAGAYEAGAPAPTGAPPAPRKPGPGPYREAAQRPAAPAEEPEVLFAGLVRADGGKASVAVRLGPGIADYLVEAFVLRGIEWAGCEARFHAEKELYASLDVPAFVHPNDGALGRLHVGSRAGGARVRLLRDGAPVPLVRDGRSLSDADLVSGHAELSFVAGAGTYEASVEDASGAAERTSKQVEVPGKLRRVARTLRFLQPGERIARADDPAIVALRVLPGLDRPMRALVDATGDYGHACCEQTAAKMLAACAMYAFADGDGRRRDKAETIVLAGVRRERSMWLRGRGFKMYPEVSDEPHPYWGPKAARYLWNLSLLRDLRGGAAPGPSLARGIDEGLAMADDTTQAYGLDWPPRRPSTCEDAYAALRWGNGRARGAANGGALDLVRERAAAAQKDALLGAPPSPWCGGAVAMRTETAYAAAGLLHAGTEVDCTRALGLANAVVKCLGDEGRLYSTVDSVAAIALFAELSAAGVAGAGGDVEIDGERTSAAAAAARPGPVESVRAISGVAVAEVARTVEEDWGRFDAKLPLRIALEKDGAPGRRFHALDSLELRVTLESGYKAGDLLWVCLPDALSRVVGGGQVKRFSIDFRGANEVRVPLAATGVTLDPSGQVAPARFAVCVRNMFEEERGGSPGLLEVTIAPGRAGGDDGGLLGRAAAALRGLLGGS